MILCNFYEIFGCSGGKNGEGLTLKNAFKNVFCSFMDPLSCSSDVVFFKDGC